MMRSRAVVLASVASVILMACGPADTPEPQRRFVQTIYNRSQTETFVRDAHHLTGTIATGVSTIEYRATLGTDAAVKTIEVTASSRGGGRTIHQVYPMANKTMPMIQGSTALLEQILRRAKVVGGDSIPIPTVLLGLHPMSNVMVIVGNGPDSLLMLDRTWNPNLGFHLAIDSAWRITGGVIPADKLTIQPL